MKKALLPLFIFISLLSQSQAIYNEWIDYTKTYYKFKVAANGIYRITQPALNGIGLGTAPAEQFQLWRNGQQIPIYTTLQTGVFGASDYIEFWGEMNDGKPDKDLYRFPDQQINDKWSLESDTAIYFLTVNSGTNLRLVPTASGLPTALTPEPFFLYTTGTYFKEKYHLGYAAVVGDYVYASDYENGEGFTSTDIANGATRTLNYPNLRPYIAAGAPSPLVKITAAGNALLQRQFEVKLGGIVIGTTTMDYFDYTKNNYPADISSISSGSAQLDIKNLCPTANDRMVVGQAELIYPRTFDFNGQNNFYFEMPANALASLLTISNFNYGASAPVLLDLTNGKRYTCDISSPPLVNLVLLPSSVSRRLLLISTDVSFVTTAITSFQQRNFDNYSLAANQGNYLLISHPNFLTSSVGQNPITEYLNYRNSPEGGAYVAKVYMIDQLVDQFAYGIKRHPLSIRNFLRFARANFSSQPKAAFLLGKGIQYIHNRIFESNPNLDKLSFLPSFGYPPSDNLLAADFGEDVLPKTPIGRLSVINGDEVLTYLRKVKQYDLAQKFQSPLIADKAWSKNVVHVIGSGNGALGNQITQSMNSFKDIISDTLYGANVNTFSKLTSAPIEQNNSSRLYGYFQQGIGIMTYFGHSSATTLEFNLDSPDNYDNTGKYPWIILLGCNAGNFFNFNAARLATKETISEKFVLAEQKGSIATVASTHLGIVYYLDIINSKTMNAIATTDYGKTMGEIMIETARQAYIQMGQYDYYARFHLEQATLHGDPALRLNVNADKPDYAIEDQLVTINPSFISVAENSFTIKARFMNLAKAISTPTIIEMKRTFPDGSFTIRRDTIPGIRYMDSITYTIPLIAARDKGQNRVTLTIDPDNRTPELYESNNSIGKDFYIFEDEIRPVFPYNLSIVTKQNIKYQASTANPFAVSRQYNFELDTTELFNSPLKKQQSVTSTGGVVEFSPVLTLADSVAYYWRVSPVPTTGLPVWNTSSFTFINNSEKGFEQIHFFQHDESVKERLRVYPGNTWKFDSVQHYLYSKNGVFGTATGQEGDLIVAPDGISYIRSACVGFSLIFNIFDPQSFIPTTNPSGAYGSGPWCSASRLWNFEWSCLNAANRKLMMDFMDSIPNNYIVVVRNILNSGQVGGFVNDWKADTSLPGYGPGVSLYHKLKNVGFNLLDSFNSAKAFIFMYQKGRPQFGPVSTISSGIYDVVVLNKYLKTPDSLAYLTSPVYGPAKNWKKMYWRGDTDNVLDTARVDIIGIQSNGTEVQLFSGITPAQTGFDISSIDPVQFPNLKLRMMTKDKGSYTPFQLKYWMVTYDPVPEGAIAPNIFLSAKDTVEVGEPLSYKMAFRNVSEVPFDSVKIKMTVTDKSNNTFAVPIPRKRPLPVNDTLQIGALINTTALSGRNILFIEANPDNDQKEQYHFNNFAFRNLFVKADSLNPLLDVTFDGQHILNRDIVSSKPSIVVKLKDEAKWLILDDTSLVTVRVRFPNGTLKRYYFSNDTLRFIPAGQAPNTDNTATINFNPQFLVDGEYELIISGKDRSSNAAGAMEYRVLFEVVNKAMISNMLNYPNPFTTSTAFVFTVTGNESPQNLKIEIMTVTGKIVREITKDELGPIHIGRNITEFKWDGTDQFGQKLANGVYLYRVVTNLNGRSLEKYTSEGEKTDKYFNKGYGKMYLMR